MKHKQKIMREFFGGPVDGAVKEVDDNVLDINLVIGRKDGFVYWEPSLCGVDAVTVKYIDSVRYSVDRYTRKPEWNHFLHMGRVVRGELAAGTIRQDEKG